MATVGATGFIGRLLSHRLLLAPHRISVFVPQRTISLTPIRLIKKIQDTVEGDTTVIEGVYVDHPADKHLLKSAAKKTGCCPLCDLGLKLHYSDVLIIQQFLRPGKGTVLPRFITGLCAEQQKNIDLLAYQAGKAGLLKRVFMKSLGTRNIMPKKPGHNLPRYYPSDQR
ncbi:hypothetical protein BV898_02261 [Hypsibius exemplaris]|uniref:28S ribosomal protein S18a, mitochondrial n=1 Tax=Hypsibius exemplaris TaxID=2072580 RepID=A0A1W0X8T2_HYPEX|nr:hypothetical protein BV898_02261 [Hypsibius exemplaris]